MFKRGHVFIRGSFLKLCCFKREKKLIVIVFMLTSFYIFEKRAANLIRMRKIALSTKIRPLDFNNKLYENNLIRKLSLSYYIGNHLDFLINFQISKYLFYQQ